MIKKLLAGLGMLMLFVAPVLAQGEKVEASVEAEAPAVAAPLLKKAKAVAPAGDEAGVKKAFEGVSEAWSSGDAKKLASFWLKDGSLINPFGQSAWNRDEVEQVAGADMEKMKGSAQSFDNFKIRFVLGGFALVDCDATISGMKNADGTEVPAKQFHVYAAVVQRGSKWLAVSVRPYAYVKPPAEASAVVDSLGDKKK
jgi:hypothetical protein